MLLSSLLALAVPRLAGGLVHAAFAPHGPARAPAPDADAAALALGAVIALQAALTFARALGFIHAGERGVADLRRDLYARLLRLPMAFHCRRRVGELSSRLASDLALVSDALVVAVPQVLRNLTLLAGAVAFMALTSPRLTLALLALLPPLVLSVAVLGRAIRRIVLDAQDRLTESHVVVEETLQGVATVKAFGNEGHEEGRYGEALDRFLGAALGGARHRAAFLAFAVLALFGCVVAILWYGTRLARAGEVGVGDLTSFMLYALFAGWAMGSLAELYGQVQATLGATQRVRELLGEEPEPLGSPPGRGARGPRRPAPRLRGDVVFEHVAFGYPARPEVEVLHDVCLEARAGERIALVGPSGAGKSTVVALLLRFYDPERGRILLDGRAARDYGLHELRGQMALVPQDVLLFGGTILDNIAYGKPGASEAEVIEAARQANAHDFISSFPDGYRTRVGERGIQLSGGQRQRVAIARAILRDPAVLILDEATSSLDSESEGLVLQALDRLMRGRTSLIIAHRLSTVRTADRIVVLEGGRTAEAGTPAEFLAREGGLYRTLSALQLDLNAAKVHVPGDCEAQGGKGVTGFLGNRQ
jgi:ATP-binding cassette subfamily B protein